MASVKTRQLTADQVRTQLKTAYEDLFSLTMQEGILNLFVVGLFMLTLFWHLELLWVAVPASISSGVWSYFRKKQLVIVRELEILRDNLKPGVPSERSSSQSN